VDEPRPDYGYDIVVTTFDYKGDPSYRSGEVENCSIYIQLKATDTLRVLSDGDTISFPIKRQHAVYWKTETHPVYLVVYSVVDNAAYWLHMQPYLNAAKIPPESQKEVTVHLSKSNAITLAAIDAFRKTKQEVLDKIEGLHLYGQAT